MAQQKITHFIVEGNSHFPLDMLRHDACWPTTGEDAATMHYDPRFDAGRGPRKVQLSSIGKPCEGRWASFMWYVREINGKKV